MSSFMDVEDENSSPFTNSFVPKRGAGSLSRPLGALGNAHNTLQSNNNTNYIAVKPGNYLASNGAYNNTTPSRLGASFVDSSMAEYSPLAVSRSVMPTAYTGYAPSPSVYHASSAVKQSQEHLGQESMMVSPVFLSMGTTAQTPAPHGKGAMKAVDTPALSLLIQVVPTK